MARMNSVKKSRKPLVCSVCGQPIPAGSAYKWTKPRYRGKINAHPDCKIPLHMVSSSKLVPVREGQEAVSNADTPEDLAQALNDLAGTAREVAEEYKTSAENQQEHFPYSEQAQEWEQWAESLEEWADELEEKANEIEGLDLDETLAEKIEEVKDEGQILNGEEIEEEAKSRAEETIMEQAQELAEIADECPC